MAKRYVELINASDIPPPRAPRIWYFQKPKEKFGGGSPFWDSYLHKTCTFLKITDKSPFKAVSHG